MSATFSRFPLPRRVAMIVGAVTTIVVALAGISAPADASLSGARPGSPRGAAAVLAAGLSQTCVVLEDGRLRCWGDNMFGELGLGDTTTRGDDEVIHNLPTLSLGDGRATVELSAGNAHVCGRRDDGIVKCWGYNEYGKLGQGDNTNRGNTSPFSLEQLPPINLGTGRTARSIAAGA